MIEPQHYELALTAFVTFFVLIDAVGVAPIFATLTAPGGPAFARRMAVKSTVVATVILFFFAFFGPWLLDHLGVSLDAFRAAGGALLFLIAVDMVFEKRQQRREERAEAVLADGGRHPPREDISVFPIGIPMIAGPGSIATAMLYMQNADGDVVATAVVTGAIALNLVLTLLIFLAAGPLMRLLGESVAGAVTRIFGVILTALAIQLLIDGIKGAFGLGV
jgi:multiple antibiotic resistance protein